MDMFQVKMIRMSLICDSLMHMQHIKQLGFEWTKKHIIKSMYYVLIEDKIKFYSVIDLIA